MTSSPLAHSVRSYPRLLTPVIPIACALLSVLARAEPAENALTSRRVTLDFTQTPLAAILTALQTQTGIPIAADHECAAMLESLGYRFTARVKDAPAGSVLDALLDGSGLAWRGPADHVEVVPAARAAKDVVTRRYPIADLFAEYGNDPFDPEGDAAWTPHDWFSLIRSCAPAEEWGKAPAAISQQAGWLQVTQTREAQDRIESLIDVLRNGMGRIVEFHGALVEATLERWRTLAPAGARELRGDEMDDLLREARNKGRLLREFAASASEGGAARFRTERIRPYVRDWRADLPELDRDSEGILCVLRPAVLSPDRVVAGVRCVLRRLEPSGQWNGGAMELPRASERSFEGALAVRPGHAFAWRLGGSWTADEPDRVLVLAVRVAGIREPTPVEGARLAAELDPRVTRASWKEGLRVPSATDAARALAELTGLGFVHASVAAAPGGGEISLAPGAGAVEALRAIGGRNLQTSVRDGILCLRPGRPEAGYFLARTPAWGDAGAFRPLAEAVRGGRNDASAAGLFRQDPGAGPEPGGHGPDSWSLPGGRTLYRGTLHSFPGSDLDTPGGADAFSVVEADLLELDSSKLVERGAALGAAGQSLELAVARDWIEAADHRKGTERLAGWTWTTAPGVFSGAAQVHEAAYANRDAGVTGTVRLRTGVTVRVRSTPAREGHRVDVETEWAGESGAAIGPDGAALATVPAVSLSNARGGGHVAEGGALAFLLTPGTSVEQKTLLLLVRVSRPAPSTAKDK